MDGGGRTARQSPLAAPDQPFISAVLCEWNWLYICPAMSWEALDYSLNWEVFSWRKAKDEPFQMRFGMKKCLSDVTAQCLLICRWRASYSLQSELSFCWCQLPLWSRNKLLNLLTQKCLPGAGVLPFPVSLFFWVAESTAVNQSRAHPTAGGPRHHRSLFPSLCTQNNCFPPGCCLSVTWKSLKLSFRNLRAFSSP